MNSLRLVLTLLVLAPTAARAQEAAPAHSPGRNEVALEAGIVSGGLSYARRIGDTPLSVGAGVWGAWEPANSFDRNVWEPLGLTVFGRYRPAPWLLTDVGISGARYLFADDCGECTGTFVGLRSVALVGRRWVFVGPELSLGSVSDDRNGSDLGAMWGVQGRVVLGWGR
ncbi:MAG TPA: hypothetical protein VK420_22990 [Longimicrobium sp.]|jgi:hypothetical protein|nr:hypothetical protein [Longimicrobium sp.]